MRKTTDKRGHGLVGGVIVTVLVVGFILLVLATLCPLLPLVGEAGLSLGILLFYIGAVAAIGVGIVIALYQRWKEVKGGEEDEAKKY